MRAAASRTAPARASRSRRGSSNLASTTPTASLGAEFAHALAEKDYGRISDLLHPEISFRGLTPNRYWEAADPDSVITGVLHHWFEEDDQIEALEGVEAGTIGDRERVGYRFRVRNADGVFVVEQQAYLSGRDGRIDWMRVVCSGFRPVDATQ